jgi:hypothetical protein
MLLLARPYNILLAVFMTTAANIAMIINGLPGLVSPVTDKRIALELDVGFAALAVSFEELVINRDVCVIDKKLGR